MIVLFLGCSKTPSLLVQKKIDNFTIECDKNNGKACFELAGIYALNEEVERDSIKMTKLLQRSCSLKYYDACYGLGYIELVKYKEDINASFAEKYFLEAISGGLVKANYDLAKMYDEGKVVKRNYKKAFNYYKASCYDDTKIESCKKLKKIYSKHKELMNEESLKKLLFRLKFLKRQNEIFSN